MNSGTKVVSIRLSIENVERTKNSSLNLSHWVNSRLNEFYKGGISVSIPGISETKVSSELAVGMSDKFMSWMRANRYEKNYQKSLGNYLKKYFSGLILTSPQNIIDYTSRIKTTSKYPILALRVYIKYLVETGQLQSNDADNLRRVLKVKKSQPDTYVPTDEVVREAYVEDILNNNSSNINLSNERLCYEMDGEFQLGFEKGLFFRKTKKEQDTLSIWPLSIVSLVKQGDDWKIRYIFDRQERLDKIEGMKTFIKNKMSPMSHTLSLFMEFIYKFKADYESKHKYEIWRDVISMENDTIQVNKLADQEITEILTTIREIAEMATNRNAFLTSFYYNLLAPFSFEIR